MAVTEIDSDWHPTLLDLSQIEGAFSFEEGFSRSDWNVIRRAIDKVAPLGDPGTAWVEAGFTAPA